MEQTKLNKFNCPIHPKFMINSICSNLECIKLGKEGPPKEFTDYILGENEILQNLCKHIEEEKKLVEKYFTNMADAFKEICIKAKTTAFKALDQQFNNFKENYDIYKGKLKKFYGDNNHPNPTKSRLVTKLNEAKDLHEYMKVINEIQSNFRDRAPTDPNLLDQKIEDIKNKLRDSGQKIKFQQEIRPKLQFTTQKTGHFDLLENFSKSTTQMLEDAFKLVNPIPKLLDIPQVDTKIMNANDEAILTSWVNPKKNFKYKLLYRASRDGFTSDAFHAKVESFKPTVVIIKSQFNKRFGGYSDLDWSGNGVYKQSTNTFLFSFDEKEIYPLKQSQYAIYCQQNYGPTFGAGHDFSISNQSNANNNSYSNLNHSYDSKGKNCNNLAGGYNFKTKEIEVFQLLQSLNLMATKVFYNV